MDAGLLKKFGSMWKAVKDMEAVLEEKKRDMHEIEHAVIAQMLEDGVDKVNAGGQPFWLKRAVHSRIPAAYRDDVQEWLKAHEDTAAMVKDYVQPATLSAWVRETFDPDQMLSSDEIKERLPEALKGKLEVAEVFTIGTRS